MPGPRNQKKKKQSQVKKEKKQLSPPPELSATEHSSTKSASQTSSPPTPSDSCPIPSPAHIAPLEHEAKRFDYTDETSTIPAFYDQCSTPSHIQLLEASAESYVHTPPVHAPPSYDATVTDSNAPIPASLLKNPFIHDPGDGPRVKDVRAFLASSLAAPPSLDDPLCMEFSDEAVLEMLCAVLPYETAQILWYNKTRRSARICPACQRLYHLGQALPDHLADEEQRDPSSSQTSPYPLKEQRLSGLCSPVCFILAAYNYPGAIRSTWGRMADELDDATWDLLDGPGQRAHDAGLGMLLKMTRCHDLGLAQLFFPDLVVDGDDSDATCHEQDAEIDDAKGDRVGVSKAAPPTAGAVLPKTDVVGVAEHLETLVLVDTER